MSKVRGRCNTNERGSAANRRDRKIFLLQKHGRQFAIWWIAQCWECSTVVTYKTMCVDRIIPGSQGGTYRRNNIRIHCPWCSGRQGQALTTQLRRKR